jgi:LPXTG-site transpeptidase (sortase) family protein
VPERRIAPVTYSQVINSTTTTIVTTQKIVEQVVPELDVIEQKYVVSESLNYGFGRTARRLAVLSRAIVNQQAAHKPMSRYKRLFKQNIRRVSLGTLAVIILAATTYVGFDTWRTNNTAKVQIGQTAGALSAAVANPGNASAHQAAEGTDETPLPNNSLSNYVVSASLPRALYISKLHIAARTLPMDVNPNGSVQAPLGIYDAGWYTGSVKPGEVGAMFIDGHASGPTQFGLFGKLHDLVVGDTLQIEKGDGTRLTYKVVHTDVVDRDKVDMKSMLLPYGNALRGLNMMTCAGTWVDNGKTLSQRVLVYTEQI